MTENNDGWSKSIYRPLSLSGSIHEQLVFDSQVLPHKSSLCIGIFCLCGQAHNMKTIPFFPPSISSKSNVGVKVDFSVVPC